MCSLAKGSASQLSCQLFASLWFVGMNIAQSEPPAPSQARTLLCCAAPTSNIDSLDITSRTSEVLVIVMYALALQTAVCLFTSRASVLLCSACKQYCSNEMDLFRAGRRNGLWVPQHLAQEVLRHSAQHRWQHLPIACARCSKMLHCQIRQSLGPWLNGIGRND